MLKIILASLKMLDPSFICIWKCHSQINCPVVSFGREHALLSPEGTQPSKVVVTTPSLIHLSPTSTSISDAPPLIFHIRAHTSSKQTCGAAIRADYSIIKIYHFPAPYGCNRIPPPFDEYLFNISPLPTQEILSWERRQNYTFFYNVSAEKWDHPHIAASIQQSHMLSLLKAMENEPPVKTPKECHDYNFTGAPSDGTPDLRQLRHTDILWVRSLA